MQALFFMLFSVMALVGGILTISRKNPLHSAISLTVSFVSVAGLYSLLEAPVLAVLQILVYAGAIMVLMIFVIMLLNQPDEEYEKEKISKARLVVGLVIGAFLLSILFPTIGSIDIPARVNVPESHGSIEELGLVLFTRYLYPFEIISVLLLAAIVGAAILAKRHRA